ncbi:MAG: hypothetical protein L6R38_000198 [Xanthoria sp. 2 TBL-2021]|nr:MAG: hypothetical protein L6R38_000198 [Xanthoria sp. 2 TBL-2021]
MGNGPFLYDHPSKYSFTGPTDKAWDPKAVTRASYAASTLSPPKPKQEGPLIDAKEFNRHPDSYFVVPYGNLNWKPMSPRTRKKVQYTRYGQLFLRICQLLGALGLLFCVICIKGTQGSTGWIIRVPAGVALLHTIYAIYHLSRSANARTAASSASYMIFAAILDLGLIPFLGFTAIMAHDQHIESSETPGHWASLFMFDTTTAKIIYTTYLVSVVSGTFHLVSLIVSIYLAVVFRKISALPPDMNPLEVNLTSRHKRNKSELLDIRNSKTSTAVSSQRDSRVEEPLIAPVRSVPFMHTRTESSPDINNVSHPHFSPRTSRTNESGPFYDQPLSNRSSRTHVRQQSLYTQPRSQRISQPNVNPSFRNQDRTAENDQLPNEPLILRSPTKSSSIYTDDITSRPTSTRPPSTRPPTTRPLSTAPSLPASTVTEDNNWITHPSPPPSPPAEFKHLRNSNPHQPFPQTSRYVENIENRTPRPLEMNPPTPVNASYGTQEGRTGAALDQRALIPGTGNMLGLRGKLDFNPPKRREGQPVQQQRLGDGYGELNGGMGNTNGKIRGVGGYPYQNGASRGNLGKRLA